MFGFGFACLGVMGLIGFIGLIGFMGVAIDPIKPISTYPTYSPLYKDIKKKRENRKGFSRFFYKVAYYFTYLSSQPKNSRFQTSEFCGLKT